MSISRININESCNRAFIEAMSMMNEYLERKSLPLLMKDTQRVEAKAGVCTGMSNTTLTVDSE